MAVLAQNHPAVGAGGAHVSCIASTLAIGAARFIAACRIVCHMRGPSLMSTSARREGTWDVGQLPIGMLLQQATSVL